MSGIRRKRKSGRERVGRKANAAAFLLPGLLMPMTASAANAQTGAPASGSILSTNSSASPAPASAPAAAAAVPITSAVTSPPLSASATGPGTPNGAAAAKQSVTTSTTTAGTDIFTPSKAPIIRLLIHAPLRSAASHTNTDTTVISSNAIEKQPGVTNFEQVIAQSVPGVASAAVGEIHIRGSHGQYSYFLDGAPLPADVSGSVSDLINPKDIETLRVYTGGFPLQYGGQLAAIFDVTAKSGTVGAPKGFLQSYAQGYSTYQNTVEAGGSDKDLSYFVSGVRVSTETDISPVAQTPLNDDGNSSVAFGKFDYQSGANDRITLDTAYNSATVDIPNTPDRQAVGQSDSQNEDGDFANLIWRHSHGPNVTHLVLYSHTSHLIYNPSAGDLLTSSSEPTLQDVASTSENQTASYVGLRLDQSSVFAKGHTLGYGFDVDNVNVKQQFAVKEFDADSNPDDFTDNARINGGDRSAYVQDDWIPGRFHANYGVRYDEHKAGNDSFQLSPRVNMYYTAGKHDNFRAFYDHLFQPAGIEDVKSLAGTASANAGSGALGNFKPETDDFYQGGWTHTIGTGSVGFDAYYRDEKNTIDDSVIGSTQIDLPVNFTKGYARGLEFTLDETISKNYTYYANYARSWAQEAGPITGGLGIGQDTNGYIFDDHDETNSVSSGLSYGAGSTFATLDAEYGSGFPYYEASATNDFAYEHRSPTHLILDTGVGTDIFRGGQLAFTANNIFDHPFIVKEAGPFTDTQWALGRQLGVKLTLDF